MRSHEKSQTQFFNNRDGMTVLGRNVIMLKRRVQDLTLIRGICENILGIKAYQRCIYL